jgi:hypothetical protein
MRLIRSSVFFVSIFALVLMSPFFAFADEKADQRALLESQLAQIQREIQDNQVQLAEKQKQRTSLERDVAIIDAKIEQAQLGIKQRNLIVTGLKSDIRDKEKGILALDSKVLSGEESLAQILRATRQIDDTPMAAVILGGSLSAAFADIDHYEVVKKALDTSFVEMTTQRIDLSARKEALQAQQQEEQELLQIQILEQQALKSAEKQKQDLVVAARGQESVYMQIISGKKRSAAEIEAQLFGLRDAGPISFGTALQYAKEASVKTGVRPALILAVLTQETNLGENVGQCLLTNSPRKGDGKGKNTGTPISRVMKPDRDVDPFMRITTELGIDPFSQVVSCPQSSGYGGAMGPAQFIASTWVLYRDRLANVTGQNPPNPWDPRIAVFGTAMLMQDNGADAQTTAAERKAALRYFAGGNWNRPAYAFYGNSVMNLAADIQSQIDIIGG